MVGLLSPAPPEEEGKKVAGISTAKCYGRIVLSKVCTSFPSVLAEKTEASKVL